MKPPRWLGQLARLLPQGELRAEPDVLENYAGDKWFARHLPHAVALPRSAASVSRLLRFASAHRLPVTARGAGWGYVGGCVPARGGIVLSLERMNRIKEIHARDFVAVAEAGVILQTLQNAVERRGLYYPPDPASRADCTIGGTLATNAGGPRCLKYGVTRDYVLGLRVVLAGRRRGPAGRAHAQKQNWIRFDSFVDRLRGPAGGGDGSNRETPAAAALQRAMLLAGFDSMKAAARALRAIFAAGFLPCALEVADEFTLAAARRRTGSRRLDGSRAMLMVELDGRQEPVRCEAQALGRLLRAQRPVFIQRARGREQCEALWELRREFSYALRDTGLVKLNEDIVVPRGRLEDLFAFTARLQRQSGLPIACFGHAGDGNIHVNVMYDQSRAGARRRRRAVWINCSARCWRGRGPSPASTASGWPRNRGGRWPSRPPCGPCMGK